MYAFVKGEDQHLCFKRFNSRKDAEEWLKDELFLYRICYENEEYGVLTNKEFFEIFNDIKYEGKDSWRRLGNRLKDRIEEVKKLREQTPPSGNL